MEGRRRERRLEARLGAVASKDGFSEFMKLDRNVNRGGRGKYALVNMRKLVPLLERQDRMHASMKKDGTWDGKDVLGSDELALVEAFELLVNRGIVSLGNETPGDQFFVMKYKDQFAGAGLQGYADAIRDYLRRRPINAEQQRIGSELNEYLWQMQAEAEKAEKLGTRVPD